LLPSRMAWKCLRYVIGHWWVSMEVMPCNLVIDCRHFGVTFYLHQYLYTKNGADVFFQDVCNCFLYCVITPLETRNLMVAIVRTINLASKRQPYMFFMALRF
jgi:hypothetical protein